MANSKLQTINKYGFYLGGLLLGISFIGFFAGVVGFFICYTDAHGWGSSPLCYGISLIKFFGNLFPLSIIILFLSFCLKLFNFLSFKYGSRLTVGIFIFLGILFFLAAPGNLGYLLYRAITLNP